MRALNNILTVTVLLGLGSIIGMFIGYKIILTMIDFDVEQNRYEAENYRYIMVKENK